VSVIILRNRKNGNAGEPNGNWCLAPNTGDASAEVQGITPGEFSRMYTQNPAI